MEVGNKIDIVVKEMKHIASVSGGRTSMGPMITSLINTYGKEACDFVFCDTGAEDVDTYRFIRDVAKEFNITITCLRLNMPKQKGKGGTYEIIDINQIGQDYYAWKQLTSKYGNPFMPGGKFCTQQMKGNIFRKYCNDTYGKDNFYTWIGYRAEEGNRIWGKAASGILGKLGLTNVEKTEFYNQCLKDHSVVQSLAEYVTEDDFEYFEYKEKLEKAITMIKKKNFRFLPELCDLQKQGVIDWWKDKKYDLAIESHRHNCLFCIEKPHGTIMLAIKDCPEEAKKFLGVVESDEVAYKPNRKEAGDVMFRKGLTFRALYEKAMSSSREDILEMSRMGQSMIKKNPCQTEECSVFGDMHEEVVDTRD